MVDQNPLQGIRKEIDEVDRQLVSLLARRKQLVGEVATIKHARGLPVYLPDREGALIEARRQEAEEQGISPDLVEDLLRRIIRESYRSQGIASFRSAREEGGRVVVIGGGGGIGRLFVSMFRSSGFEVAVLEKDDWDRADSLFKQAALVIVSVPISNTLEVIDRLEHLPPDCILADLTSVKSAPLERMLARHGGPVIGLHPMFGPTTGVFTKQVIVCCRGRHPERYEWVLEQLRIWGAMLFEVSPHEHDRMMGVIQALRHFTTFVSGIHLMEEHPDLSDIMNFSSPIYRLELGMVGRLFAQNAQLYADIIFSSEAGKGMAHRYLEQFRKALAILDAGDKETFVTRFNEVRAWFGPLAEQFLKESTSVIEKAGDYIDRRERAVQHQPVPGGALPS